MFPQKKKVKLPCLVYRVRICLPYPDPTITALFALKIQPTPPKHPSMSKRNFLEQEAPANYVAGLGRGATGFTTRSDIGPAREGPSEEAIKAALARRAEAQGLAPPTAYGADKKKDDDDDDDPRFQDPENEVGLFAGGAYDEDDDEADRIYQTVDEKMEKRRKTQRYWPPIYPFYSTLFIPFACDFYFRWEYVYRRDFCGALGS